MITVLTGGTGGAKFVQGLAQVRPQEDIIAVVNTGDDLRWWDLYVSPDVDSIMYALSGLLSRERGWGFDGDTFSCLERMRAMGAPGWFQIGDRDLAMHLRRTQLLNEGKTLAQATAEVAAALGARAQILPMSNTQVETRISTLDGELSFEEYFVRERFCCAVTSVHFRGAAQTTPAPGVIEAIRSAEAVLIAPSNPVTSIGPILAVPGIREALCATTAPVVAVSPIIGRAAVSGPAAALMQVLGLESSATGVAEAYRDFIDLLLIDQCDRSEIEAIERLGISACSTNALMRTDSDKAALAQCALDAARQNMERSQAAGAEQK